MSKVLSKGDVTNFIKNEKPPEPRASLKRASIQYSYQGMSKDGQASEVGVENDRLKTSIDII